MKIGIYFEEVSIDVEVQSGSRVGCENNKYTNGQWCSIKSIADDVGDLYSNKKKWDHHAESSNIQIQLEINHENVIIKKKQIKEKHSTSNGAG